MVAQELFACSVAKMMDSIVEPVNSDTLHLLFSFLDATEPVDLYHAGHFRRVVGTIAQAKYKEVRIRVLRCSCCLVSMRVEREHSAATTTFDFGFSFLTASFLIHEKNAHCIIGAC